jgi:hypothetical protein
MSRALQFDNIQFVTYGAADAFPGKLNPIAAAIRSESEMGGGGGGLLKTIVSVAVAIAVPYFAPAVSAAVFGTSSILASAATGAVLGGVSSAALGGDWKKGALMGGLGGGFNAFAQGNSLMTSVNPAQGTVGFTAPSSNTAVITNTGSGTGVWDAAKGAYIDPTSGSVIPNANIAYGGTVAPDIASQLSSGALASNPAYQSALAANPNLTPAQFLANSMQTGSVTANTFAGGAKALGSSTFYDPNFGTGAFAGAGGTSPAYAGAGQPLGPAYQGTTLNAGADGKPVFNTTTGEPVVQGGNAAPATGADQGYFKTLGSRVTDPSKMADMTLMLTPQIIGSAYAAQAGKEQEKRIQQYEQELKQLEKTDQAAYQVKLKEYNEYVANAKAINPDYWAQQSRNQAQVSGARSLAEGFRDDRFAGLRTPGYGASERRRASLGLSANMGSAYDRGYSTGLNVRNQALASAQSLYPQSPTRSMEGMRNVQSMYDTLDTSRAAAGAGVTKMASYMTYPFLSKDTRDMYRYNG